MTATPVATNDAKKSRYALSAAEVLQFHQQGYLGPFKAFEEEEMAVLRPLVEKVLETQPPDHDKKAHNRHLDAKVVHQLATHPGVVERIKGIMGEDLLLWRVHFFVKDPGGQEIPWHQDANYWPIEPAIIVSAWMAIDEVTTENSCVQLIPGSHRKILPHIKAGPDMAFGEEASTKGVDFTKVVNMELKPGEFFLFNERTLHHSEANRSNKRRMGMSIRMVVPMVRLLDYDAPNHSTDLVSGRDPLQFNRPPKLTRES